jgi:hypothetical protein
MFVNSDRFVDWSLRILSLFVAAVLLGCMGLLVFRWITPPAIVPTVTMVPMQPKMAATVDADLPTPQAAQVLMAPGKVFRCVVNGRVAFSDRPCGARGSAAPAN